jgi:septin family protein
VAKIYVRNGQVWEFDIYFIKILFPFCFAGFNVTILAYGQTGSGKTHTMGTTFSVSFGDDPEKMGIIPRSIQDIFKRIEKEMDAAEFAVKVTFLEVTLDVESVHST